MKIIVSLVLALFVTSAATAQEHDHMAMVKEFVAANRRRWISAVPADRR